MSWDDGKGCFLPCRGKEDGCRLAHVWLTHLPSSFRHKLEEAMLTDPWDSMKHADLGGCSSSFASSQTLCLPQKLKALLLRYLDALLGSKGSPGSVT